MVVAFAMVVLLGFAAIVVDVGAAYAQKAQLQNAADASALAIAQDCASGLPCISTKDATAQSLSTANSNTGHPHPDTRFTGSKTVRVDVDTRESASSPLGMSTYFARVFDIDLLQVRASAEVTWGSPKEAVSLPWTISECVFRSFLSSSQRSELDSTGSFTGNPSATRVLLRYDENTPSYPGCAAQNGYTPGGFGWLDLDGGGCSALINISAGEAGSNPGVNFPSPCMSALSSLMKEPFLVPLFDNASGTGGPATYTLAGFAAFQITGFRFSGTPALNGGLTSCTGNCRGIEGYFTRFVSLEEGLSLDPVASDFGGTTVRLSK
ncbi:Tad domain-containing protein [Arthrobacter sp. VKM Ac-2550]|uniref:Tad domain-containing protein n=1 Tax=Crystallibacter permensis TaxID=1938888 RepID=UPI002227FB5C|nr:Tad domain-containing protein [Arthrobacter sp. VKM Ac-2550]MCW2132055.1 Flp pilus assembly protein TadG [Arthrobacter sp. VKM Ac-2550]